MVFALDVQETLEYLNISLNILMDMRYFISNDTIMNILWTVYNIGPLSKSYESDEDRQKWKSIHSPEDSHTFGLVFDDMIKVIKTVRAVYRKVKTLYRHGIDFKRTGGSVWKDKEPQAKRLRRRLFLDYTYALNKIYTEAEIQEARASHSFERV